MRHALTLGLLFVGLEACAPVDPAEIAAVEAALGPGLSPPATGGDLDQTFYDKECAQSTERVREIASAAESDERFRLWREAALALCWSAEDDRASREALRIEADACTSRCILHPPRGTSVPACMQLCYDRWNEQLAFLSEWARYCRDRYEPSTPEGMAAIRRDYLATLAGNLYDEYDRHLEQCYPRLTNCGGSSEAAICAYGPVDAAGARDYACLVTSVGARIVSSDPVVGPEWEMHFGWPAYREGHRVLPVTGSLGAFCVPVGTYPHSSVP